MLFISINPCLWRSLGKLKYSNLLMVIFTELIAGKRFQADRHKFFVILLYLSSVRILFWSWNCKKKLKIVLAVLKLFDNFGMWVEGVWKSGNLGTEPRKCIITISRHFLNVFYLCMVILCWFSVQFNCNIFMFVHPVRHI